MGIPVRTLLDQFTSRDIAELMAYASIEPFGEDMLGLQIAKSTAAIINALTGRRASPFDYWVYGDSELSREANMRAFKSHMIGMSRRR